MKQYISLSFLLLISPLLSAQESPQAAPAFESIIAKFDKVRDFTMSPEGDEAYFSVQSPVEEISVIVMIKKNNNQWTKPAITSFSNGQFKDLEPYIAPDGLKLYFVSNRPLDASSSKAKDFDIWMVSRKDTKSPWSTPVHLDAPINTEHNEFYPAVATNGNMYFTVDSPETKGKDDIFFSEWKDGKYSPRVSLSEAINSEGYEFNSYIAPDESYLLYSKYRAKDGLGSGDIYISHKQADGSWSQAKNLGVPINSAQMDYCPFVHQKSQTLYFTSRRSSLGLSKGGFKNLDELMKEINKYDNGESKIYRVGFKP